MKIPGSNSRVLDPVERFSEIVFGLIMVLSFTCALSVAEAGREDVRGMLIGALGCNLAWGIIDAAFYLITALSEQGRNARLLREVQQLNDPAQVRGLLAEWLPESVAAALRPAELERIHEQMKQLPPPAPPRWTAENWRGALGVFTLVFLSTFPVVLPFIFLREARPALHLSNSIAIAMLYASGHMLGGYAGLNRLRTGLSMVAIGVLLVALAIALGG